MNYKWEETETEREIEYSWKQKFDWYNFRIRASREALTIKEGSETEFITEHYWGYAKVNSSLTNEYEVTHPKWLAYKVLDYHIKVNFSDVYGEKFRFLNKHKPVSVMLAEGSLITVETKRSITKQITVSI